MFAKVVSSALSASALLALALPVVAQLGPDETARISVGPAGAEADAASMSTGSGSVSDNERWVGFTSWASNLVPGDTNGEADVFLWDRRHGTLERVSVSSAGAEASGDSLTPSLSRNGRFVAFQSDAEDLVAGDGNGRQDVFVRDRVAGTTEIVSVTSSGGAANGDSGGPSISGDGRYVCFMSVAGNLGPLDILGKDDAFIHDRDTGTTVRMSTTPTGHAGGGSWPKISSDGRFATFYSDFSLVPGETSDGHKDVYVYEVATGELELVSVSSLGEKGDDTSWVPDISGDGRFVTFASKATNLVPVPPDANGHAIYVHDRLSGRTILASGDLNSAFNPEISSNGRYVAFEGFVDNPHGGSPSILPEIHVFDRRLGTTEVVSVSSAGAWADYDARQPDIAGNGAVVVFQTPAANLVGDDTNGLQDVFVHVRPLPKGFDGQGDVHPLEAGPPPGADWWARLLSAIGWDGVTAPTRR